MSEPPGPSDRDRPTTDLRAVPEVAALLDTNADSPLTSRMQAAQRAGLSFDGERDLYDTLGYDRSPDTTDFRAMYQRSDIARTIVNAPVAASWRKRPHISDTDGETDGDAETEFERAVEMLFEHHRLLNYLQRADIAASLGQYGLLFIGFATTSDGADDLASEPDDSLPPLTETTGRGTDDALGYFSVFAQDSITDIETVETLTSARYGLPEHYDIQFQTSDRGSSETVHHTRVVHIAEELLESEVYGTPELLPVYNRIKDIQKVVGASSEMYYRGADRKLHLDYQGDGRPSDAERLQQESDELVHGLRDTLRTSNVELNRIGGESTDPSGIVENLLKLVSGETGIPLRMLTGSERGELASTQDRATFFERITERREQFCEPGILRPLLDRLIEYGVLPTPQDGSYTIEWPSLFELNDLERSELQKQRSTALKNAAPGGDPGQLATAGEIREQIFGWSPERGSETTTPDPERREADAEGDPGEETDLEREAFDELGIDPSDTPAGAAQRAPASDGGTVARPGEFSTDPLATVSQNAAAVERQLAALATGAADAGAWTLLSACSCLAGNADIPDTDDLDALYAAYNDRRNMSASDLEQWANTTCFKEYSRTSAGDPAAAVNRNLRLIDTPKDEWDAEDRRDAVRMLSYHARHGEQSGSDESVSADCDLSPNVAGRLSWAVDPR